MITQKTSGKQVFEKRIMAILGLLCISLLFTSPLTAQDKPPAEKKPQEIKTVDVLKLSNGGFEAGDATVKDWRQGPNIEGVEYTWNREGGHTGKCSLAIRKTAQRYFPIASWTQTVPNTGKTTKLRVKAFIKAEKVQKAVLDVVFTTPDGASTHQWAVYIGAKKPADPPATHDWKEYSGIVAIPPNTKELTISLQDYGPGTIWFDDVTAEYVPHDTPTSLYDEQGKPKP